MRKPLGRARPRLGDMSSRPAESCASASATEAVIAPPRHVPALDGLRGVAVLGVLLFHTEHLRGGFLGVDLFFALSGFLITGQLLRDLDSDSLSLVAFWGRRARRLLPGAMFLLA